MLVILFLAANLRLDTNSELLLASGVSTKPTANAGTPLARLRLVSESTRGSLNTEHSATPAARLAPARTRMSRLLSAPPPSPPPPPMSSAASSAGSASTAAAVAWWGGGVGGLGQRSLRRGAAGGGR